MNRVRIAETEERTGRSDDENKVQNELSLFLIKLLLILVKLLPKASQVEFTDHIVKFTDYSTNKNSN